LERVYPIAGIIFMVFLLVSVQLGVDFFFSSFVCSSNFLLCCFLFSFGFVQVMINRPCNELRRAYDMFELTGMMGRKVERFGHHFQQNLSIPL